VSTIHIVGLDHFLQNVTDLCWTEDGKKEEKEQKAALANLLRKIIKEADVELIAEEGKLDDSGLGAALAKERGKRHIDITMPIIEREKRGVKMPDYDKNDSTRKAAYRIFEQYMFEKAQAENGKVVLIMGGRRHLKGLGALFTAAGCDVSAHDINDCAWYLGIPKEGAEGVIGHCRED
jgi:hypothetical protein